MFDTEIVKGKIKMKRSACWFDRFFIGYWCLLVSEEKRIFNYELGRIKVICDDEKSIRSRILVLEVMR